MIPVYSMTGFAGLSGVVAGERSLTLTLKSVNHRHLDLQIRLPMGLDALESALRRTVKAAVRRGHVELTCSFEKAPHAQALEWNRSLVQAHVAAFRDAAEHFGLKQEPDLNGILMMPGVFSNASPVLDPAQTEAPLLAATEELLVRFNQARAAEGQALAQELQAAMSRLGRLTDEASRLREGVTRAEFEKLRLRLHALLEGHGLSEDKMLAEAALLASRSDVEEELVRLKTHTQRFIDLLAAGGEVGKPLDFLLQEMNREANTLLSKTGGSSGDQGLKLTGIGLQMKVELERAREQVQNLE